MGTCGKNVKYVTNCKYATSGDTVKNTLKEATVTHSESHCQPDIRGHEAPYHHHRSESHVTRVQ